MTQTASPPMGRTADGLSPRKEEKTTDEAEVLVWNGLVAKPRRAGLTHSENVVEKRPPAERSVEPPTRLVNAGQAL
jgi:hypothetical protein